MSPPAPAPIAHYENFPVASWLCPPRLRAPIAAIYHFARTADDLADEGTQSAAERLRELQAYRQELVRLASPPTADTTADTITFTAADPTTGIPAPDPRWAPLFAALSHAVQQHRLPLNLLHDLLDAFTQDVEKTRDGQGYASDAELFDYCRRSANPIGRLLLHLYGVHDATALAQSDAICTALQLINFWQDPSVDLPRRRCYFTDEARQRHCVALEDLWAGKTGPETTRLIADCCAQARALMQQGAPLVHRVPGRMGWELRLVVQGGLRILDKIAASNFQTLQHRPTLGRLDAPLLLWRALTMRAQAPARDGTIRA